MIVVTHTAQHHDTVVTTELQYSNGCKIRRAERPRPSEHSAARLAASIRQGSVEDAIARVFRYN